MDDKEYTIVYAGDSTFLLCHECGCLVGRSCRQLHNVVVCGKRYA